MGLGRLLVFYGLIYGVDGFVGFYGFVKTALCDVIVRVKLLLGFCVKLVIAGFVIEILWLPTYNNVVSFVLGCEIVAGL